MSVAARRASLLVATLLSVAADAKEIAFFGSDGKARRGDITFETVDALLEDDHTQEHKCGNAKTDSKPAHHHVHGAEGRRELLADHCDSAFTNPAEQYAPATGDVYEINVAVHVVTNGATTGHLSIGCIESGIELLNDDFRARGGTKAANSVDTRIQFVLASTDGSGSATIGVHYYDNSTWFNEPSGSSAATTEMWAAVTANYPTTQYLNILTKHAVASDGDVLLGYATMANSAAGTSADGVVVAFSAWGNSTCASSSQNNEGATATHEVGHYLGLYHTFDDKGGGGPMGSTSCGAATAPWCYQTGDLLCDTPPQSVAIYDCTDRNSCGEPDEIHNFMDYSNDACLTLFTEQQARRMRCALTSFRSSIYTTIAVPDAPSPPPGTTPSPPPATEQQTDC
jgi:hypothetical protein